VSRILWISSETPSIEGGGGRRRQYHQIRTLIAAGIAVDVAALAGEQDDSSIRAITPLIRFQPTREHGRVVDPALEQLFRNDVGGVIIAHLETVNHVESLLRRIRLPWLLECQNVNSRWYSARRDMLRWLVWRLRERRILHEVDAVSVGSEEERSALAGPRLRSRILVAPNGISHSEWPEVRRSVSDPPTIALFSSWQHLPNYSGISWFIRSIWPRVMASEPACRVLVFGPGELPDMVTKAPRVEIRGLVPDLALALSAAQVVVIPLVEGMGARVKFAESLASGAAVVSTSVGAEGAPKDSPFWRAESKAEFAAACTTLLRDRRRALELGHEGRAFALTRLTWDQTTQPVIQWARRLVH
jgi:glycosyltransferase involved in cell wall biosynthesis